MLIVLVMFLCVDRTSYSLR